MAARKAVRDGASRRRKTAGRNGAAPSEDAGERYHVPNLGRALAILEYLAEHPTSGGISEIAEQLGYPKNSVFRIMSTLHAHGYLKRDEVSRQFSLGAKLLALGYAAVQEGHLVEKSMDIMRQVRDETNETVVVGILDGLEGVVLEDIPSHQQVKVFVGVGSRFPLHTAAPAKAVLAQMPDEEMRSIVERLTFERFTERTLRSAEALMEQLATARQVGYAIDDREHNDGIRCVGAAVLNHRAYPVGALWVTGPSYRFREEHFKTYGHIVAAGAKRISRRFGWEG